MGRNIYALLCGVNDYPPHVGKLFGCLNDVDHYHDFLRANFDAGQLNIEVLKDADATRPNIINRFRHFLARCQAGDEVLFQYAGHGARRKSSAHFSRLFSDGQDEGLVCYDSRRATDHFDLADKELAVLVAEVAARDANVTVILDCCHSGSGTRAVDEGNELRPRVTHYVAEERPLESYLDGYYAGQSGSPGLLAIPAGKHILLAACERGQKAFEGHDRRGIFSSTLLNALAQAQFDLSYADLFLRVRASVRRNAFGQNPQFEVAGGYNSRRGFLGKPISHKPLRYQVEYEDEKWRAACGVLHGLPSDADQPIHLAIYDDPQGTSPLTTVRPSRVSLSSCDLDLDGAVPSKRSTYWAEVTSLPTPPLLVGITGDVAAMQRVLDFKSAKPQFERIELVDETTKGLTYHLQIVDDEIWIRDDNGRKIQGVQGIDDTGLKHLFSVLDRIANWERGVELRNQRSDVPEHLVEFHFTEQLTDGTGIHHSSPEVTCLITRDGDSWSVVNGTLTGVNRSSQTLHLMLVYFSDDFGVQVLYNEPVEPSTDEFTITLDGHNEFHLTLDEEEGDTASHHFLLIASCEKIDDFLLGQAPLELGKLVKPAGEQVRGLTLNSVQANLVDWLTRRITIRLVRQQATVGSADCQLANQKLAIQSHPHLHATVSLVPAGGRDTPRAGQHCTALRDHQLVPVEFSSLHGDRCTALEFSQVLGTDRLSDHPLELKVGGLEPGEELLPVVDDGEFPLLAGLAQVDADGIAHTLINHLPTVPSQSRSVGSTAKLYLLKTVLKQPNVNRLSAYASDEGKSLRKSFANIADQVADARRILLLVHGLFGDTQSMAKQLLNLPTADRPGIFNQFDLVLGYDFENLNTSIRNTAEQLGDSLRQVGLGEESDKHVVIFAHSTGGLAARWLIEQAGFGKVVKHLVLCGTPNAGSPLGKVDLARNGVGILTSVAIVTFPFLAPYGAVLLAGLLKSKSLTPSLEQLNAESDFLRALNASDDPRVPYTTIAATAEDYRGGVSGWFQRFLIKIGQNRWAQSLFDGLPNDLAVTTDSALAISRRRDPRPEAITVAGHHFNYFSADEAMAWFSNRDWSK